MHGDVMRRRVRSRAVIARILCVHFDLYVHYVRDFDIKITREKRHRLRNTPLSAAQLVVIKARG